MARTLGILLVSTVVAAGGNCREAPAQSTSAAASGTTTPARAEGPALEGESCGRTDDCPRESRCVAAHCVPEARTLEGEVMAERGARLLAGEHYDDAVTAFHAAESAYRNKHLPVPSSVECGLGDTLLKLMDSGGATQSPTQETREGAARALASCLSAAPPGSPQEHDALDGLTALADRGMDVHALDTPDATLMTGHDPRPTPGNTHARVVFTGHGSSTKDAFASVVNSDSLRQEAVRCFLQGWQPGQPTEPEGTVRVTFSRDRDEYDDLGSPHLSVVPGDLTPLPDGGYPSGWTTCVAEAITHAAAGISWPSTTDHWSESVVVNITAH